MSTPTTQTGQFRFDSRNYRAVPDSSLASRWVALVLAGLIAAGLIAWAHVNRIVGQDVALGDRTVKTDAMLGGVRINSYTGPDAAKFYRPDAWPRAAHEGIWLGNSQIYAINQPVEGDEVGPAVLSRRLGWTVFGLNLPNANFQEYLVLQEWAMLKRRPDWVIVLAVYDKLREDGLRSELASIAGPDIASALRTTPEGTRLAGLLEGLAHSPGDFQGPTRSDSHTWILAISLQKIVEDWFEARLSEAWTVWRDRADTRAALYLRLNNFRNWIFGINTRTIRPMREAPYAQNMTALADLLARNKARGTKTIVYIAPLRRDHPIPYEADKYEAWKVELEALCTRQGAIFANFETLVPDNQWGTINGQDVDFMHYQGPGHRAVAGALADIIARHAGPADTQSTGGGR